MNHAHHFGISNAYTMYNKTMTESIDKYPLFLFFENFWIVCPNSGGLSFVYLQVFLICLKNCFPNGYIRSIACVYVMYLWLYRLYTLFNKLARDKLVLCIALLPCSASFKGLLQASCITPSYSGMLLLFVVARRTLMNDTFFKAVVWTFHWDPLFVFGNVWGT